MKSSFEVEPAAAPAVLEPEPTRAVVTQSHWSGATGVEGEVDSGDIRLPRLNLVAKVGPLSEKFAPGSFVFNKEIVVSDGTVPFEIVALRIKKQYQEDLPFDPDGPTPKVFNTSDEVRQAGGHFNYEEKEGRYKEIAHILLVLECPPNVTDEQRDYFMFEDNGRLYALAMWTVGGSAYTSVAKTLFTEAAGRLRNGLQGGKFEVTSEKRSNARTSWYTPLIRAAGKTTPEFQEFAGALLG